jgi:hypothetical protein
MEDLVLKLLLAVEVEQVDQVELLGHLVDQVELVE